MDSKELEKIRRRYDEYNSSGGATYKAFMFNAHADVGKLLAEVDRLRLRENEWMSAGKK